jgi:inward rectifier potassium channel
LLVTGFWLFVANQKLETSNQKPATSPMSLPEITPAEEPKDLGFGSVVGGANEKRLLNRDGSFNPRRDGLPLLRSLSFYHYFLTITWPKFFAIVVAGYVGANTVFALLYLACGRESLAGAEPARMGGPFWRACFFGVETIGTVGFWQHRAE